VPDDVILKLLKNAMLKHRDVNRFLLDGFPRSVEQAKLFEQDLAEVAFVLTFDCPEEELLKRLLNQPGEKATEEELKKKIEASHSQTAPVNGYYNNIGKLRRVKAAGPIDEVYAVAKKNFHCRFLYILGAPGAPCIEIAERINEQYGYFCIDFSNVLQKYSKSGAKDASRVKAAIDKGTALEASIACPLLLEEVWKAQSIGANNFVICGFPQSIKQMEFLEYRVPGTSRTLLLDFSLSDTVDMDIVFPNNADSIEVKDIKIKAFFGDENQALIAKLPELMRIPCSLSVLNSLVPARGQLADKRVRLVETIWKATVPLLMPSITVVLAPPCSGSELLTPMLTDLNPNCYAVDVDQLLDKELERKTELGVRMDNMLAKSQSIPLSVNLHLLKSMINQTCSTKAIVENFPSFADQIKYVGKELQIDRVFQIAATGPNALNTMKKAYIERMTKRSMSEDEAGFAFDEIVNRIEPIAAHFATQGKLEKLEVSEKAKPGEIRSFVDKAMQPQFAVIAGLPYCGSAQYAEMVAQQYGVAPAVTVKLLEEWSQDKANMDEPVTQADGEKFLKALQKYASRRGSALLVLADYPGTAEESTAFTSRFGEPKVFADLEVADTILKDNAMANLSEEDEFDDAAFTEAIEAAVPIREGLQTYWADFECYSKVDGNSAKEEVVKAVCAQLLPRAYVVVGPAGKVGLSNKVGAGLACSGKDGKDKRPLKFTVLDTNILCQKGEHSDDIEERLARESFTSTSGDALPVSLWTDLFKEAFAKSPNPLGNFVIVNMPTPSAGVSGGASIRDQFNMLEGICTLVGIVVVQCTDDGYLKWCFENGEEVNEYSEMLTKVEEYVEVQYGKDERVTMFKAEVDAEEKDAAEAGGVDDEGLFGTAFHDAARKVGVRVAQEFFRHRQLQMQKLG
jgi:adenylate kinase family enzyme